MDFVVAICFENLSVDLSLFEQIVTEILWIFNN